MANERTRRGSGGKKKWGRNKKKCERYRAEGRREKNKARRIARAEKRRAAKVEEVVEGFSFGTVSDRVTSLLLKSRDIGSNPISPTTGE